MHKHMVFDIHECIEHTTLPDKLTMIIPTGAAPLECLIWSTFSLLLRTPIKSTLGHFVVCINGPDSRTGDTALCDRKQAFLEDLRELKWYHAEKPQTKQDMPITIIRAWSRIGHPEAVEMATPWIHTDSYGLMHDDIIILKNTWLDDVRRIFYGDPDVAIAYTPKLHCAQCDSSTHQGKPIFRVPHLLCVFLICRRKWIAQTGASWCGFHVPMPEPFVLKDRVGDIEEFCEYYRKQGLLDNPPQSRDPYHFATMEMGAWIYYRLYQQGRKFVPLDPSILLHFGTMSWDSDTGKGVRIQNYDAEIRQLETEILSHPSYSLLFKKYEPYFGYSQTRVPLSKLASI